jgi:nitroreductase
LHAHRGGEIASDDADTTTRPDRGRSLWPKFDLSTADYLQVLEWTGRMLAPGKRGRIAKHAPVILSVIDRDAGRWTNRVSGFGRGWLRAAGAAEDLIVLAERLGQRWLKGIRLAVKLG